MMGVISDIHRTSVVDGPGIRTTVFLKGCPLRCIWCHNPETQNCHIEKGFGREVSAKEIVDECLKDRVYYGESNGGVTISGGEPLSQIDFTFEILQLLKKEGVHTALDTSGYGSLDNMEKILPWTDLFLFDYKVTSLLKHRELTGIDNEQILNNLNFLTEKKTEIILRCPLVPGVNDGSEHLDAISALEWKYPNLTAIEILPWHTMGRGKYEKLGYSIDDRLPGSNVSEEMKDEYRTFFYNSGNRKITIKD